MKNLKKNAFLVSAAVIMMALSACGGDGGKSSNSSSKKGNTSRSSTPTTSVAPKEFPKVNVTIDNGDGNPVTQEIMIGTALEKPANPTAPAGKKFYGWRNVKNGGQIWDFDSTDLNVVMEEIELVPFFVDDVKEQSFEAELCPAITESIGVVDGSIGMDGVTYSGGQKGTGLIGRAYVDSDGKREYKASGDYYRDDDGVAHYATAADMSDADKNVFGAFVHYNYNKGNKLVWEINSPEALSNVTLMMRLSGEYGLDEENQIYEGQGEARVSETFDDDGFKVTVNGTKLAYGEITIHNIVPKTFIDFQDFVVGNVDLVAGVNTIEMLVDNTDTLNGTIASTAPCIDSLKLFSNANLEWPTAKLSQLDKTE